MDLLQWHNNKLAPIEPKLDNPWNWWYHELCIYAGEVLDLSDYAMLRDSQDDSSVLYIRVPSDTKMYFLAKLCGFFKSSSDAKRNGWDGIMPAGYTERLHIGRWKKNLYIWNNQGKTCQGIK